LSVSLSVQVYFLACSSSNMIGKHHSISNHPFPIHGCVQCRQLAYLQQTSLIVVVVSGGSGVDLSAVLQARGGHNSSNMTNTRHNPMLIPWLGEVVGGHHPPAKPRIDPGTP
jgi:hypothetical protein